MGVINLVNCKKGQFLYNPYILCSSDKVTIKVGKRWNPNIIKLPGITGNNTRGSLTQGAALCEWGGEESEQETDEGYTEAVVTTQPIKTAKDVFDDNKDYEIR